MDKSKKLKKNLYILIIMNTSLILFALFYTLYFNFTKESDYEIKCVFKSLFGFYCPGCGGSRSLCAFVNFDFINSFIIYPPIIISALVVLDYDRRLVTTLVKKNTEYTDNFKFYTFLIIPASIILWFVIRNILLFVLKIDTVGDFLP